MPAQPSNKGNYENKPQQLHYSVDHVPVLSVKPFFFGLRGPPAPALGATWNASPTNGDWNKANNWTPSTVPNGPSQTATFATSNITNVSLSAATEVNGITFNAGASPFTISVPEYPLVFNISGVGITNNSGITQNFVAAWLIQFLNSATAGSSTSFALNPGSGIAFYNSSTAANGTFTLNGDPTNGFSEMDFFDSSTAANGSFTLNANNLIVFRDTSTAANGTFTLNADSVSSSGIQFSGTSTAGNGVFTVNGATLSGGFGSSIVIDVDSTAGNATLIANAGLNGGRGGSIQFGADSTGSTARVEVFGNGTGDFTDGYLDISGHNAPGVTIGSIEGSGTVFLGANKLTVGANNITTIFSGIIADGGASLGTGGSLGKTGKGKLTLTNANTYTGGTTVTKGTLLAKNKTGSATGTGAVQDNGGTLGGTGKISGAVTIATATSAATLAPGTGSKPGTLTLLSPLTFDSVATYKADLNSITVKSDKVSAKGVTINSGAQITFTDHGTGVLPPGTVFTLINNTASSAAIAGTFSNLDDGSIVSINGNNYQADYEGGTGNDLTLTVVP